MRRALEIIADNDDTILNGVLVAWCAILLLCAVIIYRLPDAPDLTRLAASTPAASNPVALGPVTGKGFLPC